MFNMLNRKNEMLDELNKKDEVIASLESKLDAVHRSMAVIEFTPDGHIIEANENFLAARN